ncbi:MAG: hypothetical protein ACR2KL_06640, partial [Nocardioidaceae bacterium]
MKDTHDPSFGGSGAVGTHAVTSALRTATNALAGVVDAPSWSLGDDELATAAVGAQQLCDIAVELAARLLAEVDSRPIATTAGAPSTACWLRARTRLTREAAARSLRLGHVLTGGSLESGSSPEHAHGWEPTRQRLASGALRTEQAQAITRALATLPPELPNEHRARAESFLLESAQVHDAHGLTVLGRRLLVIAPDQADAHEAGVLEAEERR